MGFFKNFSSRTNGLDIFRTGLDAGGKLSGFKPVIAPVTFVHDPVSGKGRQEIQVKPGTGLALGDFPGADGFAFGAAQAQIRINP
jgi:hypothetical protein